ncbi:hypothetical protein DPMN_032290 [Dreissena polymorpha]|uniref:Uncharacterized protein n=1 Tax=Dreissena polymorpha TaxID=45954 RepID=A0A9D4RK41_DREPO|nr:hypothetical protein DPMN_032290 [Dreissena polymorpha]
MYRTTFCEEFNYSFHITKKDQFQTCAVYRNKQIAGELTTNLKIAFEYHIKRKNRARDEKKLDKSRAKQDKSYHVATFDLETALPVPCSLFPPEVVAKRRKLLPEMKEEREKGKRSWIAYATLYVDRRPVRD